MRWIETQDRELVSGTCSLIATAASRAGKIYVLEWIEAQGYEWDTYLPIANAANEGRLDVLKWIVEKTNLPLDRDDEACETAASGGHWEVAKYLRSQGYPWNEETRDLAAQDGIE